MYLNGSIQHCKDAIYPKLIYVMKLVAGGHQEDMTAS